jgi:branched-chain amino acid transport system ATP-binding protein
MPLDIADIHVYYGKSYILQGVSLRVAAGEIVALIGRNGAGKTTTLKSIMGLVRPRRGKISLDGKDTEGMPPFVRARRGIGYAPQEMLLFKKMTVEENMKTALRSRKSSDALDSIFELFPVLKVRLNQRAGTLSGGEQQMLNIARALLTNPQILLLDEPSTGLMPKAIMALADVIRRLSARGIGILLVEEKIPLVMELAHRISIMEIGKVVYEGDAASIQENLLLRYLGVGGK